MAEIKWNENNPLVYDTDTSYLPKDCVLKLSPSKFSTFIEKPYKWFRQVILGEEGFTYSTSTVLGTVIHYIAEKVAKKVEINKDAIYEYVKMHEENDEYSASEVLINFEQMVATLVNEYIIPNMRNFLEIEKRFFVEVRDGFYAGGTLDVLEGTKEDCMIVDYKSYHSKTAPKAIPIYYKYQLLVYAYILCKLGYNVTRIRLVYVNRNIEGEMGKRGKQLKSYPPVVTVLTESITDEDIKFIESQLELCVDTCLATDDYPELTHVLWHDPRLKAA